MSYCIITRVPIGLLLVAFALAASAAIAAEPQTNRPSREQMRQELRQLTPEERQAKIRELKDKFGSGGPMREEAERRREEWKTLTPEQRRDKVLEWRAQRPGEAAAGSLTLEERAERRKQIRQRLQNQITELQAKKTAGTLTAQEERRLQQLHQVAGHFDRAQLPAPKP